MLRAEEERAHVPATSIVMVTWLPSITFRSFRPLRKTGAVGLLESTVGAALVLLTLGFSEIQQIVSEFVVNLQYKRRLNQTYFSHY